MGGPPAFGTGTKLMPRSGSEFGPGCPCWSLRGQRDPNLKARVCCVLGEKSPRTQQMGGMEHRNCSVVSRLSVNWGNMGSTGSLGSEQEALMTPPVMLLPRDDLSGIRGQNSLVKGVPLPCDHC